MPGVKSCLRAWVLERPAHQAGGAGRGSEGKGSEGKVTASVDLTASHGCGRTLRSAGKKQEPGGSSRKDSATKQGRPPAPPMAPKRRATVGQTQERRGGITWLSAFLEFVVDSETFDNPAPFCFPEFAHVIAQTPPWSPAATCENSGCTAEEIKEAQAYAQGYYANATLAGRVAYDKAVVKGNNKTSGRVVAHKWLVQHVATAKLNSRLDRFLEDAGVLPPTLVSPQLDQLPGCDRGWVATSTIIDEWFGEEARETFSLESAAEKFIQDLIKMAWNRWRRNIQRDQTRIQKLEKDHEASLESPSPTSEDIAAHVKILDALVKRLTPYRDNRWLASRFEDKVDTLKGIRDTMQNEVTPEGMKLPKALRDALRTVPTPEQAHLMVLQISEIIDAADSDFELTLPALEVEWKEGTEQFANLDIPAMQKLFALPNNTFPFFNMKSVEGPEDPWSPAGQEALNDPSAPDLRPFWHQWVGVTKIMLNMMNKKSTFVFDQVGVGKTMQAIGAIAMYEWLRLYCTAHHQYPGGLRATVRGDEPLKRGLHVIVCPRGLMDQWMAELHRCLQAGTFVVLPYHGKCSAKNREPFWKTVDQLLATRDGMTVIVLTTYQNLASDAAQYFTIPRVKDMDLIELKPRKSSLQRYTLYARDIASVVADEVHNARRPGVQRSALYHLAGLAELRVGMTGTPIVTEPMDAVSLARTLHIPGFSPKEVERYRKEYTSSRRKHSRGEGDALRAEAVHIAIGEAHKPPMTSHRAALITFVDYIRSHLGEYVLRRTSHSLTPEGKPIHNIPPIKEVPVIVQLTDEEMEVQEILASNLAVEQTAPTEKNLATWAPLHHHPTGHMPFWDHARSFYIGIRQALLHHCAVSLPGFTIHPSTFNYADTPSTKINALLSLLHYHVGKTCAPPAVIQDGVVYPPEEGAANDWNMVPGAHPDKILVYSAFPSLFWIISSALELLDLEHITLHGGLPAHVRTERLRQFREGSTPIMLMSNVGTTGLNIAFANILIIVDNLWSAQENEQLVGRLWRHPQKKTVIRYQIIADNTSDVFIASVSSDKGLMHHQLMEGGETTLTNTTLLSERVLLDGMETQAVNDAEEPENEEEGNHSGSEEGAPESSASRPSKRPRPQRQVGSNSGEASPATPPSTQRTPSDRKGKGKETVSAAARKAQNAAARALQKAARKREAAKKSAGQQRSEKVPTTTQTASGSGLVADDDDDDMVDPKPTPTPKPQPRPRPRTAPRPATPVTSSEDSSGEDHTPDRQPSPAPYTGRASMFSQPAESHETGGSRDQSESDVRLLLSGGDGEGTPLDIVDAIAADDITLPDTLPVDTNIDALLTDLMDTWTNLDGIAHSGPSSSNRRSVTWSPKPPSDDGEKMEADDAQVEDAMPEPHRTPEPSSPLSPPPDTPTPMRPIRDQASALGLIGRVGLSLDDLPPAGGSSRPSSRPTRTARSSRR
ncbi:hypothetical protein ACG7TL_004295 [Trametes sanguinea]